MPANVGRALPEPVIEASGLTKDFKKTRAVDGASFTVLEGEVFGFLGPNGAGKSTTIKMLTTVLKPTAGSARVLGHDIEHDGTSVRRSIGLVPQEYTADEDLTGLDNLLLCASLYDLDRATARQRSAELLELVQLAEAKDRKVETYSGGMRRRLELACGLLHRPKLLFLDEPTLGLDVQTRRAVWEHITDLRKRFGMTLFLTTHYLEEADRLCDRIAVMDKGRIVAIGTPAELKSRVGGDQMVLRTEGMPPTDAAARFAALPGVLSAEATDDGVRLTLDDADAALAGILAAANQGGIVVQRLSVTKPSLDDAYLKLTGHALRQEEGSSDEAFRQRVTLRRARP